MTCALDFGLGLLSLRARSANLSTSEPIDRSLISGIALSLPFHPSRPGMRRVLQMLQDNVSRRFSALTILPSFLRALDARILTIARFQPVRSAISRTLQSS